MERGQFDHAQKVIDRLGSARREADPESAGIRNALQELLNLCQAQQDEIDHLRKRLERAHLTAVYA